jgi:LytS/YehU family sensor histidine kinase
MTLWGAVSLANVAFTHGLRTLVRQRGWLALPPGGLIARMIAATFAIAALSAVMTALLSHAIYGTYVAPLYSAFYEKLTAAGQLRNQSIATLIFAIAWVALYLAFAMQRHRYRAELRQRQLGEALQAAELRLLKSQLNPHFLFNALNGLRSLIADEPAQARVAVTQLARMLRYTLAAGDEDLVSLERELELVDDYLALESLRLADRLRIERDIAAEARTVRIPAMLLQTLVENAIKHGISVLKEGGVLRVAARVERDRLVLEVTNPRLAESAPGNSAGVGLRNSSERLRLMYGERASLRLDLSRPGLAVAELSLPA